RLFRLGTRHRDVIEREIDQEIEAHVRSRAEQLERRGMPPEEARAEALRRFGPVEEARERMLRAATGRERRLGLRGWADALAQDLRHAWRGLKADKALTAVIVLVMALGIGANAAVFGILDRLLLSGPDHVREPERVFRVAATVDVPWSGTFTTTYFGHVTYALLRDHAESFEAVAAYAYSPDSETIAGRGEAAEPILTARATWDLFPLLGARPWIGRYVGPEEDRPGAPPVVVLGHGWWQRRFGSDPDVIGRTVTFGGEPHTVVGVAPRGFTGVELGPVDAWLPMAPRSSRITDDWQTAWDAQWLKVVGRLAPGVTRERAAAELTRLFRNAYEGSEEPFREARLSPDPLWHDPGGGEAMEVAVARWLLGVSLVVLLIAAANVANLLLARALRRRREVAVRLALGVSRARLIRLVLAQSLLLALAGGLAALAVVPPIAALVRATLLPDVEWTAPLVSGRIALVAVGLALATGLLTGLVPALRGSRHDLTAPLRGGAYAGGPPASRLRNVLAVAQAALSVVLLVGAGLFVRSYAEARTMDLGVETERVIRVDASWPSSARRWSIEEFEGYRVRSSQYYEAALERARRLPGVAEAAITVGTPFGSSFQVRLEVPGWETLPRPPGGGPYIQAVTPGYFGTVGLELVAGRGITAADRPGSERVAVVNRTMAEALWGDDRPGEAPGEGALGKCLHLRSRGDEPPPCTRVVGVVEDAHRRALREEPAMQYYVPFGQEEGIAGSSLLVRAADGVDPGALIEPLRKALLEVDPSVLWIDVALLDERLLPQLRPWRLGATLMGVFGALALVIAAVGLYSLLAHMVASRMAELGIRSALGAQRRQVLGLVLRQGLGAAGLGLALGVLLALLGGRQLGDLLFETAPHDPLVYGGVVAVLAAAALLACLVPGRRATKVDPAKVLRAE
ncbi:MAG TPA: ADOP family duplicated permease, partial [Thermoanaerobaculia bacterium]|nr:ADOP family duplicated permease [Thermoanaerobaculia bacterium]